MEKKNIELIVNHLKSVGFFFQSSEIYGGLANTWDCGPLGTLLKNNLKKLWIDEFITKENSYLLDSAIFMNNNVWKASGHTDSFLDSLIDCKKCKNRFRADHIVEKFSKSIKFDEKNLDEIFKIIVENKILCPSCSSFEWTEVKNFNLMFKTPFSVNNPEENNVYLRPETAQGIFINFSNICKSQRAKLPFGVGQIGKSFRNEITPGNFVFRTKEFEQMELEFFVNQKDAEKAWEFYLNKINDFLIKSLNLNSENIKQYNHPQNKLSHYSKKTTDFQYNFPFGWEEMWGIANRGDFDLKTHSEHSKKDLRYLDPITHEKYYPWVIEPSVGVERLMLAVLCDSFNEEEISEGNKRIVLKLKNNLAPYLVCVNPLSKQLESEAQDIYNSIKRYYRATYDDTGNIGKRYRRQDAIGTPFCITVDFESQKDDSVTIRYRDSMKQERIKKSELSNFLHKNL